MRDALLRHFTLSVHHAPLRSDPTSRSASCGCPQQAGPIAQRMGPTPHCRILMVGKNAKTSTRSAFLVMNLDAVSTKGRDLQRMRRAWELIPSEGLTWIPFEVSAEGILHSHPWGTTFPSRTDRCVEAGHIANATALPNGRTILAARYYRRMLGRIQGT